MKLGLQIWAKGRPVPLNSQVMFPFLWSCVPLSTENIFSAVFYVILTWACSSVGSQFLLESLPWAGFGLDFCLLVPIRLKIRNSSVSTSISKCLQSKSDFGAPCIFPLNFQFIVSLTVFYWLFDSFKIFLLPFFSRGVQILWPSLHRKLKSHKTKPRFKPRSLWF